MVYIRRYKNLKFITSKELLNNPAKTWQNADEETVVTVNGKPVAIIIWSWKRRRRTVKIHKKS
jgi:hypothetical protein